MRRFVLTATLLAGCATPFGQKVTILLSDRTIDCVADDTDASTSTAVLELDQERDFYQVELVNSQSGEAVLLSARRDGKTVTFVCPEGFEQLTVRHATILQALRDDATAGVPVDDGNANPPAP